MILVGDVLEKLATLPADSIDCVVTSPPYWGLRDYGVAGQLGLEERPEEYVGHMRMVFEQVRRVLKREGTLWLNLGDSYAAPAKNRNVPQALAKSGLAGGKLSQSQSLRQQSKIKGKLKQKDLAGIPWSVAFALRDDGWYLRQDIIWHKPNPMPESVRDRCTKAHEYIFLFSKEKKYHFDIDAIKEPSVGSWNGSEFHTGKTGEHQLGRSSKNRSGNKKRKPRPGAETLGIGAQAGSVPWAGDTRQKRSVWTVTTKPFKGAHFATFPPKLIEPCILAGCPKGGTVLDPFFGAGTVGVVAKKHGRNYIGIEINPEYARIARERIA